MHEVIVGSLGAEHISVGIAYRSYPSADDYWDGNWVNAVIKFQLGAFKGKYDCSLRTEEFLAFYEETSNLSRNLAGQAIFQTMEEQVEVVLKGDGKGHIVVSGLLQDEAGIGNKLTYSFEIDQTFLQDIIRQLREIADHFPVKGTAEGKS